MERYIDGGRDCEWKTSERVFTLLDLSVMCECSRMFCFLVVKSSRVMRVRGKMWISHNDQIERQAWSPFVGDSEPRISAVTHEISSAGTQKTREGCPLQDSMPWPQCQVHVFEQLPHLFIVHRHLQNLTP